jgi:hypothetical protein
MNNDKIGNGGIGKNNLLSSTVPSTVAAVGHLINNPLDDCQASPLLSSSTRDSGCYSSSTEEWLLMQSQASTMPINSQNYQSMRRSQKLKEKESNKRADDSYSNRTSSGIDASDKVIINVSGLRFETRDSTLQRYPNTLLGDKQRRTHYFDYMNNEYFFERHRSSFEAVLYFYQSGGRLTRPENISAEIFLEEIKFFDLGRYCVNSVDVTFFLDTIICLFSVTIDQ